MGNVYKQTNYKIDYRTKFNLFGKSHAAVLQVVDNTCNHNIVFPWGELYDDG